MKHSSNEKSFRKSKAKPSSNCDNFASRDAAVSSLCGEGRFLRIEPCPDNPDLPMMFNFESLISEKSPSSMKDEHSYIDKKKSFGEYESSKSSANCENLSEYATFSQKVSNSSDEEGFLSNERIEHCPDLSMRYDLVSEKNLNTLKEKHLFAKEKRLGKYKVSKLIYNRKNFASDDAAPDQNFSNSRGKVGFLEGRIEPCPKYVKFSMLFDWKNLDCLTDYNTINESQSSDDEMHLSQVNEASKPSHNN
ncbi:hypothetical protein AVEN_240211-1 [Araneus ventricosus]|uniref:Uncharacterized protein n=1 Tax=Araneus ventricosus TaxID=182803 RepID=A0A4Y2UIK4_ARAVE|nr:hypothetical protein AVEN_240211-1 [Araneus ventricosus]